MDLLKTGKYGLLAHQNLLNTTSNNISNVNTEGYVRQQTIYYTSVVDWGIGESYTRRVYDQYVQRELYSDKANAAYYEAYSSGMSNVDSMLSDSSMSIATSLDSFFSSLQDAVQNPTSTAYRNEVIAQLKLMVSRYQTLNASITDELNDVNSKVDDTVQTINDLVVGIYNINRQINTIADSQSDTALQLQDKRDQLVYQLSEYVDVKVVTTSSGDYELYLGNGQLLCDGDTYATLHSGQDQYDPTKRTVSLTFNTNTDNAINIAYSGWGGKLGGLLESTNELRQTMSDLGQLAVAFADALNVLNNAGITLENTSGADVINIPSAAAVSNISGYAMTVTFNEGEGANVTANDYQVVFANNHMYVYMIDGDTTTELDPSEYTAVDVNGQLTVNIPGHGITMTFNQEQSTLLTSPNRAVFYVQPTRHAAYNISLNITKAEDLAFASAVRGNTSTTNQGNAVISFEGMTASGDDMGVTVVNGYPQFTADAPTQIVIDANGYYQIRNSAGIIGAAPASCNGTNIFANATWYINVEDGFPGYDFSVTGTVVHGDTFNIEINTDGFADNSNGVQMGLLQQQDLVYSSASNKVSFTEGYANLVSSLGTAVMSAEINLEAAQSKLEQTENLYSSSAGVNLDEEAVNLIRFQQCYAACAKIITTSQTTFDALISAI